MKPGAVFRAEGLGAADPLTPGCKAVRCIKLLCKQAIHLSSMDEASAIDGSRPLEQNCGRMWHSLGLDQRADAAGPFGVQGAPDDGERIHASAAGLAGPDS